MEKPYSPSCDRNKEPILEILRLYLTNGRLLEMGSGTGQHAVYFAQHFPEIEWVTADIDENHNGIKAWLDEAGLNNTKGPVPFEIGKDSFPDGEYNYVFTANSLHIMSWDHVKAFIALMGEKRIGDMTVLLYGPFNYKGQFTSESNRNFEKWLKDRNPLSGIRNFEDIQEEMQKAGFGLRNDHEMPANNRLLVFDSISCAHRPI